MNDVQLQGVLEKDAPLSRYTSWRVGGSVDQLYRPKNVEDLRMFLSSLSKDEPLIWLGLGSNTLVRDGGFRGTAIITQGCLNEYVLLDDSHIKAQAGVACGQLARFCARNGLVGLEFFAGIPGTVGGALRMNAGAYGGETWSFVESVETVSRDGTLHRCTPSEYDIAYRHVASPREEWFLSGTFLLKSGDADAAKQYIRDMLQKRNASQPTNLPNGGSVFRNPPGDHAARLIEACGLKGYRIGGASISEKHANFIVNDQSAKASDIEALIELMIETVKQQFGIQLQPEVHVVGQAS